MTAFPITPTILEKQIDQLDGIFRVTFLAVLVAVVASLQAEEAVNLFGLPLEIGSGFAIISIALVLATLRALQTFLRINDALRQALPDSFEELLTALVSHRWFLNPFAYSGSGPLSLLNASLGLAGMVCAWWIGRLALFEMNMRAGDVGAFGVWTLYLYLILGLLTVAAVTATQRTLIERSQGIGWLAGFRRDFAQAIWIRLAIAVAAGFGVWRFLYYEVEHIA